jgi:hypothetical protein
MHRCGLSAAPHAPAGEPTRVSGQSRGVEVSSQVNGLELSDPILELKQRT